MKNFMDNIYSGIRLIKQICICVILLIIVYTGIMWATFLTEMNELRKEDSYKGSSYENRGHID